MYNTGNLQSQDNIEELIQLSINHRATDACSKTYKILFGQDRRIYHPLQWTKSRLDSKSPSTEKNEN